MQTISERFFDGIAVLIHESVGWEVVAQAPLQLNERPQTLVTRCPLATWRG
jgi:hypothetical protein